MSDYNQIVPKGKNSGRDGAKSRNLSSVQGGSRYIREVTNPPPSFIDETTGEVVALGKLNEVDSVLESRRIRYRLQDASRTILYSYHGEDTPLNPNGFELHHRTCTCNRKRISPTAQIVKSSTNGKAFYSGLMSCANARTCPVCAAPINERKANEMRVAANQVDAIGLQMSMLTFTVPHDVGDHIDNLVPKISKALSSFWRGAPALKFKKKYGIVGNIRSFEVRYGGNGWHPHFHIIIFSKSPLPHTKFELTGKRRTILDCQDDGWNWILNRWQTMCVNAGLNTPNQYGMDIQDGSQAGEYITKFGSDGEILETKQGNKITWDMADEMTKGNVKMGRKGSLSPWDLLEMSLSSETLDEKRKCKGLFLFYARAMKGVTQIKWSRGLRSIFGLNESVSDEEILQQEEDKADLLCHITPVEWKFIITNNMRAVVLELAENGGANAVAQFLFSLDSSSLFSEFLCRFKSRNGEASNSNDEDMTRVVTSYSSAKGHSATVKNEVSLIKPIVKKLMPSISTNRQFHNKQLELLSDDFILELKQAIKNKLKN